jgi:hypothetical protein
MRQVAPLYWKYDGVANTGVSKEFGISGLNPKPKPQTLKPNPSILVLESLTPNPKP